MSKVHWKVLTLAALSVCSFTAQLWALEPSIPPPSSGLLEESMHFDVDSPLRAQVRAVRNPVISSEMAGRINKITVRDGDRFSKGQRLIEFDCAALLNKLARSKAALQKKQRINEVKTRLNTLGSTSQLELVVSAAEVAEALAEVALDETIVKRCVIFAPFSGRVVDVIVQQHQFVQEGQPLMEILDFNELEIDMIIPSNWLRWLKPKHAFRIRIDETGKTYDSEIIRISGKVDPVSQSIKVYGRLKGRFDDLLPGMSGRVFIKPPPAKKGE
jgi:membrane fusion protein (multidrug efflux system)